MKRSWGLVGLIVSAIVIFGLIIVGSYNGLIQSRESVKASINTVQAEYQRRSDLIPNIVSTVEGAANFERDTLNQVVEARAKATQITIDPSNTSPEQLQQFQSAQSELSQALGRLLAVAENYPELKATEAFRDLSATLEGTENRIKVARADYGTAVQAYNTKIQRFPTNITAALFGFEQYPYFSADQGADNAPTVDFESLTPSE